MLERNKFHLGDVRQLIDQLEENSVSCVVTSPPYWALRHYGIPPSWWGGDPKCEHDIEYYEHKVEMYENDKRAHWQNKGVSRQTLPEAWKKIDLGYGYCKKCGAWLGTLGLEPDFNLYVKNLCDIFDRLKRPLRKDGTLWVNLGDTYYTKSGSGFHFDQVRGHPEGKSNIHMANAIRDMGLLPSKCLVLAPMRFAVEMCNRGWTLRNVIIWQKNNVIPTSAKDRFTVDFEYFFFFTQNRKYWFERQLEPYATQPKQQYRPNPYPDKTINKDLIAVPREVLVPFEDSKYDSIEEESNYRQGMHSNRGSGLVEKRDLRPQKEFVDLLRSVVSLEEIINNIPLKPTTVEHWFRYDETGFSYPSKKDWELVLEGFPDLKDKFPELTEVYYVSDAIMGGQGIHDGKRKRQDFFKNAGRNKRTVWNINTQPCKEAHFAVFPPELVKTPIRAGCPEYICTKCGKPREKIIKRNPINVRRHKLNKGKCRDAADGKNPDYMVSGFARTGKQFEYEYEEQGYTDCGCGAEFIPGLVLDIFSGTGTTCRVARSLKRDWMGFDVSEKYIEIAEKLINEEIEIEKEDSGDDMGDMMLL